MLTTHDIGNLFESMRIAYGGQWKHGSDAIGVWRKALRGFSSDKIMQAATDSLSAYVDHPPTLPQFLRVISPPAARPTTYLPAAFKPRSAKIANRVMIKVLLKITGVDEAQLRNLVDLKNALVQELGDDRADKKFIADMYEQLSALAKLYDRDAKAKETVKARRQFCIRQGLAVQ